MPQRKCFLYFNTLLLCIKISADDFLKYFSPSETICMTCQILFSRRNKKNIVILSSAKSAHSMVSVKVKVFSVCKQTMNTARAAGWGKGR